VQAATYRRITEVALVLLVAIVVTGAGVRLTGSGLGCTDWPRCTDTTFTPSSDLHARIEFANRLITGLVSAAVAAAVLGSLRLRPRRRDLLWLSWGLVAGVVGQIVLGGLVVLSHLNPWLVQGHFVLSMVLVGNAMVLRHRAGRPAGYRSHPAVTPALARWGWTVVGLSVVVLLTGTLVTGSGPHSGHQEAEPGAGLEARLEAAREVQRLPLAVHDAARVHGATMIVFLGALLWVLVQLRRHHQGHEPLHRAGTWLLTILLLQGGLGYTQYFSGVPPMLVALHILGASLVWVAALHLLLEMIDPSPADRRPLAPGGPLESTASAPAQSGREHTGDHPHGDLVTNR
jgi:cytochrome c oxidase assembly protein subunit 15